MNEATARETPSRRPLGWVLLEFFGSMNLAISLLVIIAVASVIGTVLQQNQPYTNYVLKFGPFWFEVFGWLGLYDVYGSGWFIGILGFLILSTGVCLYRQVPVMLREMVRFRTQVQLDSLRGFQQRAEWLLPGWDCERVTAEATSALRACGYRWRLQNYGDHRVAAGMRGGYHRLGYLFTHAAVVVIGIGGLMDGNLWLKLKEWRGQIAIERRDLASGEVPAISRLQPGTIPAFRGNVMLPEGSAANFVFLRLRDGYLVQELPFAIELKEFQVAYYDTGQPKTFISQVRIHDREHLGDQPLEATIQVNHPLVYRGYAIYQSDFGDGGSKLELSAWPLVGSRSEPLEMKGEIGGTLKLTGSAGSLRVELDDFRLFNLLPEPDAKPGDRKFRNFGPSVGFKLRDAAGQAREYFNYMAPARLEDRLFFITGMRTRPGDAFTYLHIPAANNSPERFLKFNARVHDAERVRTLLERATPAADKPEFQHDLNLVRANLLDLFVKGGFAAITERAKAVVPPDRLPEATKLYLSILRDTLAEIFLEILREEGVPVEQGVGAAEDAFFNDAVSALAALPDYGAPFFLQMTRFQQVEASGLQVTYSGGTTVVYIGFALLIAGVFIMFYTAHRRVWAWLAAEEGGTRLVLAGTSGRRQADFAREFARIEAVMARRFGVEPQPQPVPPTHL